MPEPITVPPDDEFNRQLVANVHPSNWVNPSPADRYNLVVIGAGTAGLVTAIGAAGLGARVALVERHLMGGDCLNVGCVPSKALIRAARACAGVRNAGEFGIETPAGTRVNFASIMERMRRLRSSISPNDSAERFRSKGVDVFLGEGRFTGSDGIAVGDATLRFKKAVIATGARAIVPEIPGLSEAGFLTNETVFSLTELPRRLAVIGSGPIGCELAQTFARFGAQVTVIERSAQILPSEDRDASQRLEQALIREGLGISLHSRVLCVTRDGTERIVSLECNGKPRELIVDEILVGTGRAPNVEKLGLESADVKFDSRAGVIVDDYLRTTNSHIFAAGDVCSRFKFTHAADAMARIVIQNALFWAQARVSRLTIPWCTYTDPEIAHVGVTERGAAEEGHGIETFVQELHDVDRAILDGQSAGFVKIHVRRGSDKIVGATIVAAHAGEMISEITLAMTAGMGLRKIAKTIHPYPTQAEAIKRVADACNRKRLTPFVQSLVKRWLAWQR
jgi:pyruvate/2-oxoglutarate dehydrogenase complex dihydrolipoamide dehydrogenase (E3) component